MEKEDFVQELVGMAGQESVPLSREQAGMCYEHIALMLEWNRKVNLTRITDFREILSKHIMDSMIPALRLPTAGLALDVGTGPGFPGIPLGVLRPDLNVRLLEANRRKVSFLKAVLSRLPLRNIHAVQGRWEDLGRAGEVFSGERFNLVVMRAVRLEAGHLQSLAPAVLLPGGVFAWWAGPAAGKDADLPAEGPEMAFEGSFSYELPVASSPRRLLIWRKKA